jgi:uncharacterized iron-regulated membrane protein
MSMVGKDTSKRLLAVHGWSGVFLGLFLYLVVITGTVAVLGHEIGQWSVGGSMREAPLAQPLDTRVKQLALTVDPKYREDVALFAGSARTITLFFHTHGTNSAGDPDDLGVRFLLDPETLDVLRRDEGYGAELPADRAGALDDFLATLHTSLHAPNPVGLYLTGLAGFVMLFAVASGIILHKHLLRDLFVAPRRSSRLLNRRDRHILAGSWSLPFGFLLAFTGTFFSFAGAIGLPIVAQVAFGGDQVAMIETIVGVPEATSNEPAAMGNLDAIIAQSSQRTGSHPDFVSIIHWGTADAKAQLTHLPSGSAIEGSNQIYNLVTGAYEGVKPDVGTTPSLGSKIFAWIGPLHFGHFAGLLSKLIWVSLGLATAYVTLTGLRLWVERRPGIAAGRVLGLAIPMVGYGVPIGLVGSAIGFLCAYRAGDPVYWTGFGFLAGCAAAIVLTVVMARRCDLSQMLMGTLGTGMMALPVIRLLTGGPGWVDLLSAGHAVPVMIDLLLLGGGIFNLITARRGDPVQQTWAQTELLVAQSATVPAE